MVMLQVVQVNELFDQIDKLRTSQWQEVCLKIIGINTESAFIYIARIQRKSIRKTEDGNNFTKKYIEIILVPIKFYKTANFLYCLKFENNMSKFS